LKFTNNLIHETSPYLLQHAHNPVNWYAWGDEAWNKAKEENKLVIVSIGYSACHWCHVMEKECFENEPLAEMMNKYYVCIKVDREERPDVDQFYMDAVSIMHGHGGWPLNAFALPDGRPVYAGTYFPATSWRGLLHELAGGYKTKPQHYIDYAEKLLQGIKGLSIVETPQAGYVFKKEAVKNIYEGFARIFDHEYGGKGRAPKFPMPDNYLFLLNYHFITKDQGAIDHIILTLNKMAEGGIYDQIGGGFARYSTDAEWKVPHFEKMLYDNAQLISLYSQAWQHTGLPLYKKVVYETIECIKRELISPEGGFYCALDADSEGVEGKYYVWTEQEIREVLNEEAELIIEHYGVNNQGFWEQGNNILLVAKQPSELAEAQAGRLRQEGTSVDEINNRIGEANKKLLTAREKRIKPGLDDKILTSWNLLMQKGLLDAYNAFGEEDFLRLAKQNKEFLDNKVIKDGQILHSYKNNEAKIAGFLEDYAFYIQTLIAWYQVEFNEAYLHEAKRLVDYCIQEFKDKNSPLFYFTSEKNNELVSRKIETGDNVIASPNSVMAVNLFLLGKLLDNEAYQNMASDMLVSVMDNMVQYPPYYSNWARLLIFFTYPFYEVAVMGEDLHDKATNISSKYIPNKILAGSIVESTLPLLESRLVAGKTLIYICENKTCQLPLEQITEAISTLHLPQK